ncbi:MAG: DUF1415 domain-containing protein [Hylemonella sp.]
MTPSQDILPAAFAEAVRQDMQIWLERAVIGLNLCPFAKSVHVKGQIHWVVSPARDVQGVLDDLARELQELQVSDPAQRDTTVLVLPLCLADFLDFNDFLAQADAVLTELGLQGELQIASFHPQFQFAGTETDDISNYTNRAPYPALHLLREASIDRAVEAFPEAEAIYEKNMQVLEQLGHDGWDRLGIARHAQDVKPEGGAGGET